MTRNVDTGVRTYRNITHAFFCAAVHRKNARENMSTNGYVRKTRATCALHATFAAQRYFLVY